MATQCNPADILLALERRLVDKAIVGDPSQVWWRARDTDDVTPMPPFSGQRDLILRQRTIDPVEGDQQGGGKLGTLVHSYVDVTLRTSLAVDRAGTDKQWLIQHYALHDLLLDALQGFVPFDGDNQLVIEGMYLVQILNPRKQANNSVWGSSTVTVGFHYVPRLDFSDLD